MQAYLGAWVVIMLNIVSLLFIAVYRAAGKIDAISNFSMRQRRQLKGHQGKVLCMDWSTDKRHIVSSSQVYVYYVPYNPKAKTLFNNT